MNYHNITHDDMNNGDGLRVVLWISGCSHHCYNCQNPQTWEPNGGIPFDDDAKQEILNELSKDYISGITFSGGDPLHENNIHQIYELIKEINKNFPKKSIWLYTGYLYEKIYKEMCAYKYTPFAPKADEWITRWEIVGNCDVLVDGPYKEELRDITLKWRGSGNQRVIDMQKTIEQGKVVLYCE